MTKGNAALTKLDCPAGQERLRRTRAAGAALRPRAVEDLDQHRQVQPAGRDQDGRPTSRLDEAADIADQHLARAAPRRAVLPDRADAGGARAPRRRRAEIATEIKDGMGIDGDVALAAAKASRSRPPRATRSCWPRRRSWEPITARLPLEVQGQHHAPGRRRRAPRSPCSASWRSGMSTRHAGDAGRPRDEVDERPHPRPVPRQPPHGRRGDRHEVAAGRGRASGTSRRSSRRWRRSSRRGRRRRGPAGTRPPTPRS